MSRSSVGWQRAPFDTAPEHRLSQPQQATFWGKALENQDVSVNYVAAAGEDNRAPLRYGSFPK